MSPTSETSILAEQKGSFFQFDEKREEDQHTLQTIDNVYKSMPKLMSQKTLNEDSMQSMVQMLCQVSEDRFVRTNWMVR